MQSAKTPTSTDRFVGRKIRETRKHAGLTMMDLAENLNISYQQIQKYEAGKNRVSAGVLFDIACLFNLPIECFFPTTNVLHKSRQNKERNTAELISALKNPGVMEALDNAFREISYTD